MKLPTPGGLQSKFAQIIMVLVVLNMFMAGGSGLIRVLLGDEWQAFQYLAPILLPIGIGIAIGMLLRLGVAVWRAQSWRWRR